MKWVNFQFSNHQSLRKQIKKDYGHCFCFEQFQANDPFLYPLETLKNLWFSRDFRGYRNGTLT